MTLNPRTREGSFKRTEEQRAKRRWGFRDLEESKSQNILYQNKSLRTAERNVRDGIVEGLETEILSNNFTPEVVKKAIDQYVATGGDPDQFAEDVEKSTKNIHLTAEQRWVLRNAGNNYTGARNLGKYYDKGYNR